MIWSAGSATAANCSLCEAGTFGTGSGQGALIGFSNVHTRYLPCEIPTTITRCLASLDLILTNGPAGTSSRGNCSLCEAGTFWTGSGQGALIGLSNFNAKFLPREIPTMMTCSPGQPRPDPDEWACWRSFTWQLQPVRGRDLRDGIRSGCFNWFVIFQ